MFVVVVVEGVQIHVSMREEHVRFVSSRDDKVGRSSCYTCSHVPAAAVDRRIEGVGKQALFWRLCDPMAGTATAVSGSRKGRECAT
jgi:hypothetical protein